MTKITLVKKVHPDGTACRKCRDVLGRIERDGVWGRIDRVVVADERDPDSEGMRLAARFHVERAPFFIVERPGEPPQIYTVYLRLLREELKREASEPDEVRELMSTARLDFI
ncbi:MAG: hypothetical protein R3225_03960 [Halofilum sp. (in: g-proteobacteria)]|nr:hypothetical protein [Halofilum sp. (in: g-proteobacteria)]